MSRHDNIVKIIYLNLLNKYSISRVKRLKDIGSMSKVTKGKDITIVINDKIQTDARVENCKPDIMVHDKINNTYQLIEVGVTNISSLQRTENLKW